MKKMFWKGKNVLVTGAHGFLGSWMCRKLIERRAHVIGLIRDFLPESYLSSTGREEKIDKVIASLEDDFLLERILNEFEIDTACHLAAQPIVTIANRFPL